MKSQSIRWVEIAKLVGENPFVKVECPNCNEAFLNILIIPWQGNEAKVDVHLVCEKCNDKNIITKNAAIR